MFHGNMRLRALFTQYNTGRNCKGLSRSSPALGLTKHIIMCAASVSSSILCQIHASTKLTSKSIIIIPYISRLSYNPQSRNYPYHSTVVSATEGSANSSKSDEKIPSWAKPDSAEPPPWARNEGQEALQESSDLPFGVYLLASAITAIAAIGSIFEYINEKPVFGVVYPDSVLYAPILGFFAITGLPSAAFLWYKSVQVANKEAEEQDRRDGY